MKHDTRHTFHGTMLNKIRDQQDREEGCGRCSKYPNSLAQGFLFGRGRVVGGSSARNPISTPNEHDQSDAQYYIDYPLFCSKDPSSFPAKASTKLKFSFVQEARCREVTWSSIWLARSFMIALGNACTCSENGIRLIYFLIYTLINIFIRKIAWHYATHLTSLCDYVNGYAEFQRVRTACAAFANRSRCSSTPNSYETMEKLRDLLMKYRPLAHKGISEHVGTSYRTTSNI